MGMADMKPAAVQMLPKFVEAVQSSESLRKEIWIQEYITFLQAVSSALTKPTSLIPASIDLPKQAIGNVGEPLFISDPMKVPSALSFIEARLPNQFECRSTEIGAVGRAKPACTMDVWSALSSFATISKVVSKATVEGNSSDPNGFMNGVCLAFMMEFIGGVGHTFTNAWGARLDCANQTRRGLCLVDVTAAFRSFAIASQLIVSSSDYCPGNIKQRVLSELYPAFQNVTLIFMQAEEQAVKATAPDGMPGFDFSDLLGLMMPVMRLLKDGTDIALEATRAAGGSNVPGIQYLERALPKFISEINPATYGINSADVELIESSAKEEHIQVRMQSVTRRSRSIIQSMRTPFHISGQFFEFATPPSSQEWDSELDEMTRGMKAGTLQLIHAFIHELPESPALREKRWPALMQPYLETLRAMASELSSELFPRTEAFELLEVKRSTDRSGLVGGFVSQTDPAEFLDGVAEIMTSLKNENVDCRDEAAFPSCATDVWHAISKFTMISKMVVHAQTGLNASNCDTSIMLILSEIADIYSAAWATRAGDCRPVANTPGLCLVDVTSATSSFAAAAQHLLAAMEFCAQNYRQAVLHDYPAFYNTTMLLLSAQGRAVKATAPGAPAAFSGNDLLDVVEKVITLVVHGANFALSAADGDGSGIPAFEYLKKAFPAFMSKLNPSVV